MERHSEEKQIVVLTAEDVKNVEDFFVHFKLQTPEVIKEISAKIKADPKSITFDDQRYFRAAIAYSMNTVDHPLIKDPAFDNIRKRCDKVWYESQFDMDIDRLLREPKV